MRLKDLIHLKGEVLIQSVDANGIISTLVEDKNLIVSNGRNNICTGLVGTQNSYISDVVFGNGGTIVGNSNVPLPVASNQVTVNSYIPAVNGIDYVFTSQAEATPSPRAVFSIVIPAVMPTGYSGSQLTTSLNGKAISEIALMLQTTPASAFAIKNFPSISKSDTISLIITWTIYV